MKNNPEVTIASVERITAVKRAGVPKDLPMEIGVKMRVLPVPGKGYGEAFTGKVKKIAKRKGQKNIFFIKGKWWSTTDPVSSPSSSPHCWYLAEAYQVQGLDKDGNRI